MRVDRPVAGSEADLAADRRGEVAGERRRIDPVDAIGRQRPVAAVAPAPVAVLALPALDRGVRPGGPRVRPGPVGRRHQRTS